MIKAIYRRTIEIFKKTPAKLWGISLLSEVLSLIVLILGSPLPIILIPVIAAINAGMIAVYFSAYNGGEPETKTLLGAFSDFKTFKHVAGGMCWMYLWIFLWALIPIAGPFIAIYKCLSYAFTPYILNEEKSVGAMDALKKSMRDTKGYKLNIFAAVILPSVAFIVVSAILGLLALIPFVGVIFTVISVLLSLVYSLFAPMFLGLIRAGFYDYGKKPVHFPKPAPKIAPAHTIMAPPAAPDVVTAQEDNAPQNDTKNTCPVCGHENTPDKKFCMKCGAKL